MSTKFEQLLDLIVNEDLAGADALFHEIVVEKSRGIYENLIAEEDEEMDEAADEDMDESSDDEEVDESKEDDEMDESEELEDSYMMDADETGDETDDFGGEISADGDNFDAPEDGEQGPEGQEDSAIMDIKNAIAELEAAFAELEQAQGGEEADMGMEPEFGDEEGGEDDGEEMMGNPAFEGRRMTREYTEKVGHNYGGSTQKAQGQYLGAGTGEKQSAPVEGKSAVSSGKGKPESGANAKNLNQGQVESESNTGTSPAKVNKGINPEKGEKFAKGIHNVDGVKSGVKTLSKQGAGYPGNNKTAGPVGSGTGDKAGQTSVGQVKSPINGAPNRNA